MEPKYETPAEFGGELQLLRRYGWLFPVLGAVLTPVLSRWGWFGVALDPDLIHPGILNAFRGRYLLVIPAFTMIPLAWWVGILVQRRFPGRTRWLALSALGALMAVGGAEIGVRHRLVQNPLWLAVRARLAPGGNRDFFTRELAYVRLAVMDDATEEPRPTVVFVGTSQVLENFDFGALREALPERRIKRRAIAGMVPYKMLAAQRYLSLQPGATLVLYQSELDLAGVRSLDIDWIRPLASAEGMRDVLACADSAWVRPYWRRVVDGWIAARSELWRVRDYANHLVFHVPGPRPLHESGDAESLIALQKEQYISEGSDIDRVDLNTPALDRFLQLARERDMDVVIFEGRVNPVMRNAAADEAREKSRAVLAELAAAHGCRFVPVAEQGVEIEATDWLDGTHLNEAGRERFTRYVAEFLGETP